MATDISAEILEFAAANARKAGLKNVDTQVGDAENLELSAASFDAAICCLGLMFCPDPLKGLQRMHHALKPRSRACVIFIRISASAIIRILGSLGEQARDAAWKDMEEQLGVFQTPTGWEGPNELLLTAGSR